jgi:hypothetical protein
MNFFSRGDSAAAAGKRVFTVPAFQGSLRSIIKLASSYTERFPKLDQLLGEHLIGGVYDLEDAKRLAECILVGSEIEKSDTLINLRYDMEFGSPELLGVPFVYSGGDLADALFGITVETPPFLRRVHSAG